VSSAFEATADAQSRTARLSGQLTHATDFWRAYAHRITDLADSGSMLATPALDSGLKQQDNFVTVETSQQTIVRTPPEFIVDQWRENFIPLAKWEGRVLEVTEERFVAVLTDELHQGRPEEAADIPLEEVSSVDRDLVTVGAFFFWTVGYNVRASGQRSRVSIIRFRRLPRWSVEEIENAYRRVRSSNLRDKNADTICDTDSS
jgi:hypothetical protein